MSEPQRPDGVPDHVKQAFALDNLLHADKENESRKGFFSKLIPFITVVLSGVILLVGLASIGGDEKRARAQQEILRKFAADAIAETRSTARDNQREIKLNRRDVRRGLQMQEIILKEVRRLSRKRH